MKKWAVLFVCMILLTFSSLVGCSKDRVDVNNSVEEEVVTSNEEDELLAAPPLREPSIPKVHLKQVDFMDLSDTQESRQQGRINYKTMLQNGTVVIYRDVFRMYFIFAEEVNEDDLKERLILSPHIPYEVKQSMDWGDGWLISIMIDQPIQINEEIHLNLRETTWEDQAQDQDIELILKRVEEPKVELSYLTNPVREIRLVPHFFEYPSDFGFYDFLPEGQNQFKITFSKPMNQKSVEEVLLEQQINKETKLIFDWQDYQNAIIIFDGKESEKWLNIRFVGALDTEGYPILEESGYGFKLAKSHRFYSYDINTGKEDFLFDPIMKIGAAELSHDKQVILFRDYPTSFWYRSLGNDYFYEIRSNQFVKRDYNGGDRSPFERKEFWYTSTYSAHEKEHPFAIETMKKEDYGKYLQGVIYSPNEDRAAVFISNYDYSQYYEHDDEYTIDILIYDRVSGDLLQTYPSIITGVIGAGTDAIFDYNSDKEMMYKPKFAYWLSEHEILLEHLNKKGMQIGILDTTSGSFNTILKSKRDPILSPSKDLFAVREGKDVGVYDLNGSKLGSIKSVEYYSIIWSDLGDHILYKDNKGTLYIYDLLSKSSKKIADKTSSAGWLDEETILIYK